MNKFKDDEIVLLLTATVTPQFNYMAHNASMRLNQYITAIKWYLENTPFRIIIGENSACYNLKDNFDVKYSKRMELICYQETNTTRTFGYNEMLILRNVYERSIFLKDAKLVFKITGRLIVPNVMWHVAQLRRIGGGNFIAADLHYNLDYIDSRFFAFTVSRYSDILKEEPNCCAIHWNDIHAGKCRNGDNGKWVDFESTIGAVIRKGMIKDMSSFRYLCFPIFVKGIEGYHGTTYDDSFIFRLKLIAKKTIKDLYWWFFVNPTLKSRLKKLQ